jgi:glutamate synthase (NADPH/NADH) small chain
MPGSAREVLHAEEEGINFEWLAAPEWLDGTGAVTGVRGVRLRLGDVDASGRQGTERIDGATFALDTQMVIIAAGFDPEPLPHMFGEPDLAADAAGRIRIDRHRFATSLEGVFAAGDVVRGASLVVWAIRDGRDASSAIHRHLSAVQEPRHDAA